jgi:hypothetical protein
MKELVQFIDQVTPEALEAYLEGAGWTVVDEHPERCRTWDLKERATYGVLVPLRREFGDFRTRITQALDAIADTEGRLSVGVLWDLLPEISRPALLRLVFPRAAAGGEA